MPSWRDSPRKRALIDFVAAVTTAGGEDFVRPAERIAVFDNDGTLWVEQPMFTQFYFVMDRIRTLAPQNPGWQQDALFRAAIAGDTAAVVAKGMEGLLRLAGAAQAGNSPEEFQLIGAGWLANARDSRWGRPFTRLVYQPMLEVLAFLTAKGFKNFIVSGGGVEFIRSFAEDAYGIPPQRVVGSTFALRPGEQDGRVTLLREPDLDFVDDGPVSRSASRDTSAVARLPPSAIRTTTCTCCATPRKASAGASV